MGSKAHKPTDVFKKIDMRGGDVDQCWPWLGSYAGNGRPAFDLRGRKVTPYRLVYELFHGKMLSQNVMLLHSCDNGARAQAMGEEVGGCCNPHHLKEGTHTENMDEMKGRQRHGLPHHTVRAMKKLLGEGRSHKDIADLYGVDESTVSRIKRGKAYKHVKEDEDGDEPAAE